MAGDPLAVVQDLHRGGGQTHVDLAFDQGVRHRVVVPLILDAVVVKEDIASARPLLVWDVAPV